MLLNMSQRNLGGMGEHKFGHWCAEVGLTSNPSQEDNKGWDYIVEFPFVSDDSISADMQTSPIKCQIQVKATDEIDRKKVSVKNITLSNLRHLATAHIPTFILFIEYKGQTEPCQAFLVHIDKVLIEKILKRVRKADVEEKINQLNKMTLSIGYDESHELPSLDGKGLKQTIEKYVGNMNDYVINKLEIIKTVGFYSPPIKAVFNFNVKELSKLIDATLGLDREIEISDFQSSHVRFDIEKNDFLEKGDGKGFLTIKPANRLVVVRFKTDKFSAGVCFDAEEYLTPSFLMPENSIACRIKGDFFEIKNIHYSDEKLGKSEFSINWIFEEQIPISVDKINKIISLLEGIRDNNFIIVEVDDIESPPLDCYSADISLFLDDIKEPIKNTYQLVRYFDLEPELLVSLSDILYNKEKIRLLIAWITSDFNKKEIIVESEIPLQVEILKNTLVIFFHYVVLGGYIIGAIIGLYGVLKSVDKNKYNIVSESSKIKKLVAPKEKSNEIKENLNDEIEKFIENNYKDQDIQIIILNIG
jgi:hypothetical protein